MVIDTIYAIAFSILLLHTDAHNKNVRHKMNKDTFIAHTKLIDESEDIPNEILDVSKLYIDTSDVNLAKHRP